MSRLGRWHRQLDDPIDVRALALLRIALGPIVLIHLRPFLEGAANGVIYSDRFTLPFWSWFPELPRGGYVALLWITAAAAILLSVGLATRYVSWVAAVGVTYNVLLSQTHFHHNRAFLIILLFGIAVLPAGRTVSLDAAIARRRGTPLDHFGGTRLGLSVLRFEIATVYCASGFSKLIDGDWWGGTVTRIRVEQHQFRLADVGIPDGLIDILTSPGFHSAAAKVVVLTELFIGIGLLVPRLRKGAIWMAMAFHVSIQFTAAVQTFSLAALAALVVWIDTPSGRCIVRAGPRWTMTVRLLDWTGQFRIESAPSGLMIVAGPYEYRGADARWFVFSRLPATFWFATPIGLLRRI
jgi:uncharacterized membrane protein YphA (DoxX/SURF4 family)